MPVSCAQWLAARVSTLEWQLVVLVVLFGTLLAMVGQTEAEQGRT